MGVILLSSTQLNPSMPVPVSSTCRFGDGMSIAEGYPVNLEPPRGDTLMVDQNSAFGTEFEREKTEKIKDATDQVKADIDQLIEGFDLRTITDRVEQFGRDNPIGLALSALTLGVAVGVLMQGSRRTLT